MPGIDAEDPMPSPQSRTSFTSPSLARSGSTSGAGRACGVGLSVSVFAEQEGLDEERLYRWRHRFARERKAEAACRAATGDHRASGGEAELAAYRDRAVEIVLVSGVVVRVAETIDPARLARLVAAH
jgi:hypothetical protein